MVVIIHSYGNGIQCIAPSTWQVCANDKNKPKDNNINIVLEYFDWKTLYMYEIH